MKSIIMSSTISLALLSSPLAAHVVKKTTGTEPALSGVLKSLGIHDETPRDKKFITYAFKKVPKAQWGEFIETASSLFVEDSCQEHKVDTLFAVACVPIEKQKELVEIVNSLCTVGAKSFEKLAITEALALVTGDRNAFARAAKSFFAVDANSDERRNITCALARVPEEERERIIDAARILIPDSNRGSYEKTTIINALNRLPEDKFDGVVEDAARRFAAESTAAGTSSRILTIRRLAGMPPYAESHEFATAKDLLHESHLNRRSSLIDEIEELLF